MSDREGEADHAKGRSAEERALSNRLRDLERRLDENRAAQERSASPARPSSAAGFAMAGRLAADFIAGVLIGGAIGWGIDRFFGTSPWGLIVFLLLGFGAGILSVLRSAGLVQPGPPGPDEQGGARR